MRDISIIDRILKLFDLVFSSPFFVMLFLILVLTILIFILFSKLRDGRPKILASLGYMCLIIYVFIQYGTFIYKAGDNFVDSIFQFFYFPNILTYIVTVIIITILMLYSILRKKSKGLIRIANVTSAALIQFFFILVMDIVVASNINILERKQVYINEGITVLVQASMSIIAIWLFAQFVTYLINKLTKKIEEKIKEQEEFDKIKIDDDFKKYEE